MTKKMLWYVGLGLLCCVVLTVVVFAATNTRLTAVDTSKGPSAVKSSTPAAMLPGQSSTSVSATPAKKVDEGFSPIQNIDPSKPRMATVELQQSNPVSNEAVDPDVLARRQAEAAYLRWMETGTVTLEEKALIEQNWGAGQRTGNPLDDTGGPDAFGYQFVDNLNGDSATYEWIELRGDAEATWFNAWTTHDDGYATTQGAIGFNFPFYGISYSNFWVTSNGQIEFGATGNASWYWTCLPQPSLGPMIAADMYDAHLDYGGMPGGVDVVGYKNFGDYTVIEYDSIGRCCSPGTSIKFEAILFNDGRIKLQWNNSVLNNGTMGTVGIQDATGSTYLEYRCQTSGNTVRPLDVGRAIWFFPGEPEIGRCCYGDPMAPECVDNFPADCATLGGTWSPGMTCATDPCPINRPCESMLPADATLDPMPNTPWAGTISGDCGMFGKWVGSFSAQAGYEYHFDLCPDAPGAGTANFDIDIKICDVNGTILAGQDGSCTALSWHPNNFVWTATSADVYYVVLSPYYSYDHHECTGTANETFTMEYYEFLCSPAPAHDNCENAVVVNAFPFTETNDDQCATMQCAAYGGPDVYYVITTTEMCDLMINFCGSTTIQDWIRVVLDQSCPCSGTWLFATNWNWADCGDGNATLRWNDLPPGTYYYGKYVSAEQTGPYTISIDCVIPPPCIPDFTATIDCQGEYHLVGDVIGAGDNCDLHFNVGSQDQTWELVVTEAGTYTFDMCVNVPGGDPCVWDSYIYLTSLCCGGTIIGAADDGCGCFGQSLLAGVELVPGTYYLDIEEYAPGQPVGAYDVTITCQPPCTIFPVNDLCENAEVVVLPFSGTGDNTCAQEECASLSGGAYGDVWYQFTTTEACDLSIDFCGTTPAFTNAYIVLTQVCGGGLCTPFIFYSNANTTECGDGNYTINWLGLQPGTYYYPVLMQQGVIEGPFSINIDCAVCAPIPPNDNCVDADPPVTLPTVFTGDNSCATHDCPLLTLGEGETWHQFETFVTCDLTIDFCGTNPIFGDVYIVLASGCPCAELFYADNWNNTSCDGNWTVNFLDVPPGIWYYPVLREMAFNSNGPYTINVNTPCPQCDPATETTVLRAVGPANAVNVRWFADQPFGVYTVWKSVNPNNDGDPDNGADPDWAFLANIAAPPAPGYLTASDAPLDSYVNYVVVHDCAPRGRCCYGDPQAPSCQSPVTEEECAALAGIWTVNLNCEDNPCQPVPLHDNCENGVVVNAFPFTETNNDENATMQCEAYAGPDVYYTITTTETCNLSINFCGSATIQDWIRIVLDQSCPCSGTWIFATTWNWADCGDGNASMVWNQLPAGTYYYGKYVSVDQTGPYTIEINCAPPPPPPVNDDCGAALPILNNTPIDASNTSSTTDGAWTCAGGGSDVWYSYVSESNNPITVNTCGGTTNFDTALMALPSCGGTVIVCNDDFCGLQSQITFAATTGTTYWIAVGGYSAGQGNFTVTLTQ